MKNMKSIRFFLVMVLMLMSCKFFFPDTTKDTGNAPAIDFTTPAEPLNVEITLDDSSTITKTISPNGGSLTLTAADGSIYTLEVPQGALEFDTAITMTAVKNIEGAPLDSGAVAAVQLEPSGLFFNEMLTLTIVPAQEIPIENQIIFGYEKNGQDYHLAVVDPKSREIKIFLMEFSGAGVGSGSDSAWAANLQVQGNETRVRLQQNMGALFQRERSAQLLGMEGDPEIWDKVKSSMEQYYDQVILKEMAAAELDCQFALRAIQDLLALERQNQILGINGRDADGNIPPIVNDLGAKLEKLGKIWRECKKAYTVSGSSNEVSFSGTICGLDKPFTLNTTFPGGSGVMSFTPSSVVSGTVSDSSSGSGCTASGQGDYSVAINEDKSGTLQFTVNATMTCPDLSSTRSVSFTLPLQPAPEGSCP